ncbi:MAG: hypothetical protein A2W35_09180 [Chloroflexi bacterium RBG_16_57_11]|nr:MAG: hypothetical protein A2W35_09180 [Chloroflexi bacterium RBG_16_57_11]
MKIDRLRTWLRAVLSHKYFPIIVLILVNIVIGSLVVVDYGQSQDEHLRLRYADKSLSAYSGEDRRLGDEKGAFYVMVALVGSKIINQIRPDWLPIEAWHFMHFLAFLMGLFFLYRLCLRFVGKPAAFAATLMFNTQPLLWGHAFINPKDIPFMAFFLASVDMGLEMAGSLVIKPTPATEKMAKSFRSIASSALKEDWSLASRGKKLVFTLLGLLSLAFVALVTIANVTLKDWIAGLVRLAYTSGSSAILGRLFSQLARNAQTIPVDSYVSKAVSLYPYLIVLSATIFVFVVLMAVFSMFPRTIAWSWQQYVRPFLRQIGVYVRDKKVLAASLFLGLSTAIRVAGPLSGILVGADALLCKGRKVLPALVTYFGVGLLVSYLFWPALWKAPVQQYSKSVSKALDFPWEGKVMFAGVDYEVTELPRRYLPTVLSLQFTETAMLMFIAGCVTSILWLRRGRLDWRKVVLITVWFVGPVIAIVIVHPVIYDNFRHLLFITPPLFIFAAIGFQGLFEWIKKPVLSGGLVVLLMLPNVYWLINLHPYQYVYYNSLVGGVQGAYRSYEMDYWGTSYRAAIEYVNQVAPPESRVIVLGTDQLVSNFARPDLKIDEYRKLDETESIPGAYVILSSRHNKDQDLYPGSPSLFSVERAGVVLAVVKLVR